MKIKVVANLLRKDLIEHGKTWSEFDSSYEEKIAKSTSQMHASTKKGSQKEESNYI